MVREKPAARAAFQHRDVAPGALGSRAESGTIGTDSAGVDLVAKPRRTGAVLTIAPTSGRVPRSTP